MKRGIYVTLPILNELLTTPLEKWSERGVRLRAVRANADGIVASGILKDGRCFYRVDGSSLAESHFVIERA